MLRKSISWISLLGMILLGCSTKLNTPLLSSAVETIVTEIGETPSMIVASATSINPSLTVIPKIGREYYIASVGDDSNAGNEEAPFETFKKAVAVLEPGDTLIIRGGIYYEMLVVEVSGEIGKPIIVKSHPGEEVVIDMQGDDIPGVMLLGDYLSFADVTVRGSGRECVTAKGNYQWIWGLTITECFSSGIQLIGRHIEFFGNKVFGTVLRNEHGNGGSWNSAVKVLVGGQDLVIRENEIYENWGEGIAVTRGVRVVVQRNTVYDNWASNIYVDNSLDIQVTQNFSYCTENAPLANDGYPANAFSIGEEEYEGWGARLARVTIMNNIGAFCKRGIGIWSAEVSGGGLDTIIIVHNTFWGSRMHGIGIYVNDTPVKAQNTLIANNIFQQEENRHGYIEDIRGINIDNNFWVGTPPREHLRISGPNDSWGDVGMVEQPGYTPDSFILAQNSNAIGIGVPLAYVEGDFFGNDRGILRDMGAIQYQS